MVAPLLPSLALVAISCLYAWLVPPGPGLLAQGLTAAAIHGIVQAPEGFDVDGTDVRVVNTATGFTLHTAVRHGRFVVNGLEVGGPYTVSLRRPGFHPERREGIVLVLGEAREVQVAMRPIAVPIDTLRVAPAFQPINASGGTGTTLSDSLLHRLPSLNRNLYDFARLAPQLSTKIGLAAGGLSGGGTGFRFNNFLISGVPQRTVGGSVPPEFAGARSVPLDAIREYQILLAPFDVRYGDFAGALVNAVTRSGTNELRGSAFVYARSDALARRDADSASAPYERVQYGFSIGGPIRRDRLHFFVASDLQHLAYPAAGPYLGQPAGAAEPVPVSAAELARLDSILRGYGLVAGSGGAVENSNPLRSAIARLDLALPEWNSRALLWVNETRARSADFSRSSDLFALSTHSAVQAAAIRNASFQLHTGLRRAGGGHNELLASYFSARTESHPDVRQPIVRVAVPGTGGGAVTIVTGTPAQAHGAGSRGSSIRLRDDLTLPLGASHLATLGFEVEHFHLYRRGVSNAYGTWSFASLDSLARGVAESFQVSRDFGGANAPLNGGQYAVYAGDRWHGGGRLSLTMGVRAEILAIRGHAPYNALADSIFGRRTDQTPSRRPHLSPRLGFTWDLSGTGREQLRGGVGVFTGRPPGAWLQSSLSSYGVGIGTLRCGRLPADLGPPPRFDPDPRAPPLECANRGAVPSGSRGNVELLDRRLRMAQALRGVLAYDRRLAADLTGTIEALVTRSVADFVFMNLNLVGPQGVDRHGRVLYGTIGPTGLAAPALRSGFPDVIELRNSSRGHALQLSARLEKRFSAGSGATAYYTFSRVRDAQTPLRVNVPGSVNWSSRAISGRHDDLTPGISLNDIPHRVVFAGAWRAPWSRWATEFSLYYVGESGSPFTYLAWSPVRGRGDLNADGSTANDPIYVPRSALDPAEIRFGGWSDERGADNSSAAQAERIARQQAAFERFVSRSSCLARQRGRILERNSCREPWSHTSVASLRQTIPLGGRVLEAQVDVSNLLNLLRRDWGLYRVAAPALLEHVGQTPGTAVTAQPVFRFDPARPRWRTLPAESAFQLQLALRYRF